MADISGYLETIAHEPKGRLVKQAIYDALLAINAQAEIRPPAKREVPVGDMISDAGCLVDYVIGDMELGEIGFSSDIQLGWLISATGVDYYEAESSSIYAGKPGRVFVVAVDDWNENSDPPVLEDGSFLTWTQLACFKSEMSVFDGGTGSSIKTANPSLTFTMKGIVHSHDELPVENIEAGDTYVFPLDDSVDPPRPIYWWYESSGTLPLRHAASASDFKRVVSKRITVWSAKIESPVGIVLSVHNGSLSDGELTMGVFYVSDTQSVTVSELPYRVCLIDNDGFHGVKTYDEALNYKGEVNMQSALPRPGVVGDTYYYTRKDQYMVWNSVDVPQDYEYDPSMYMTYSDYVEEGQTTGVSEDTHKIFVVVSLDAFANFQSALTPWWGFEGTKATCSTLDPCCMSAWMQVPGQNYGSFNYIRGNELYRWVYNGSVAVIPLEIGERSTE